VVGVPRVREAERREIIRGSERELGGEEEPTKRTTSHLYTLWWDLGSMATVSKTAVGMRSAGMGVGGANTTLHIFIQLLFFPYVHRTQLDRGLEPRGPWAFS